MRISDPARLLGIKDDLYLAEKAQKGRLVGHKRIGLSCQPPKILTADWRQEISPSSQQKIPTAQVARCIRASLSLQFLAAPYRCTKRKIYMAMPRSAEIPSKVAHLAMQIQ
jgi:hypothetical protein